MEGLGISPQPELNWAPTGATFVVKGESSSPVQWMDKPSCDYVKSHLNQITTVKMEGLGISPQPGLNWAPTGATFGVKGESSSPVQWMDTPSFDYVKSCVTINSTLDGSIVLHANVFREDDEGQYASKQINTMLRSCRWVQLVCPTQVTMVPAAVYSHTA